MSHIIKRMLLTTLLALSLGLFAGPARAVLVHDAAQLANAVAEANWHGGDREIVLASGIYQLDDMLWVEAPGVSVRGQSGNREDVVIKGRGMAGDVSHIFNVAASRFSVRDLSMGEVANHALQTQINVDDLRVQNVRFFNTGEQMLKVASAPGEPSSDRGLVEGSLFEYTAGMGPQYYIGGIDAHNARDWIVRGNIFRGIRSPGEDVAEHAIHFWSGSAGTLVENNVVINCDRGIGFGLGDRGHQGGVIRNNMIFHDGSGAFADVGIGLESAPGAKVLGNTILMMGSYPNAIEYRFGSTKGVVIANNLTNRAITSRDGGSAELTANYDQALAAWFVNPAAGDLHLASKVPQVVDQGVALSGLWQDFDYQSRPQGKGVDIGADELSVAAEWLGWQR